MIDKLSQLTPDIHYIPGDQFCWSPKNKTITYLAQHSKLEDDWALLHETGHALLGHQNYKTDFELVRMEMAAWIKAKELALKLNTEISEDHIQECLDSYRDWLHRRSICPKCGTKTIQKDQSNDYICFNCHEGWQVSASRFCRSYRISTGTQDLLLV